MNPELVRKMIACMKEHYYDLTEEEKDFVLLFAVRTGDEEKTNDLLQSLLASKSEKESGEIVEKFRGMLETKEAWVEAIEEFYLVTEQLHFEEKAALRRLQSILKENGISIDGEEVK